MANPFSTDKTPNGCPRLVAFAVGILSLTAVLPVLSSQPLLPVPVTNSLTLSNFLQLVIDRNDSLQVRILEFKITEKRLSGERGVFEPELVLGYDRVENERENTAEQRRSSGVRVFEEENNIYNAGLESLIPTGARLRFGYSLRDLRNNLQDPPFGTIVTNTSLDEYVTFAGLSLTQPILKDAWFPATLANIRLAALASDVAYQEYRRQMMVIISTAEAAYWNLHLAQEQVRFFRDSVRLAEDLVADNQARVDAGQASELEVLEAMAGSALRKSRLGEAEQNYFETIGQLLNLISEGSGPPSPVLVAVDRPGESVSFPPFVESGRAALEMNPDYLGQLKRLKQEGIRVTYAKNQRLPQLDLKASYGLNGLGSTPGDSWDDLQDRSFPSWSIGLELRIPLGGGIRTRGELAAARLRQQQALVTLKDTETQILNAIEMALRKAASAQQDIHNYSGVIEFNERLLDTEMARLEAGKSDSRRVLEVDASLFEARNAALDAQVKYERAQLELELVQGTILRSRSLDLPQDELERRTEKLLREIGVSDREYKTLAEQLQLVYNKQIAFPDDPGKVNKRVPGGNPPPETIDKGDIDDAGETTDRAAPDGQRNDPEPRAPSVDETSPDADPERSPDDD